MRKIEINRELEPIIFHLKEITGKLRAIGILLACSTFFGISVLIALMINPHYLSKNLLILLSIIYAFPIVLLAIIFESYRKQGLTIYEEINDEIQSTIHSTTISERPNTKKPPINVRIVIRSYLAATDLPLIPGKYGPLMYVLFAIFLIISFIVLWSINNFDRF